ncbi:MAG TPA: c-type cytochrome, partial [Gammaproteobacteria bacterium]|nr:c-type cytochrome [Gammaproteobacteria bacterium]
VSATQPETFSPKNLVVLGGLLAIALILGEIVVGPSHDGSTAAVVADTLEDVAMRLKPVITLDDIRSGKSTGGGAGMTVAAAASDNASKTPEQLYQGACFACHGTGAAGAPKLGDAAAWTDRIAKGLDALVSSAVGGIGAMPPRGGSPYDDDQILSVIEYMLDNSK